MNFLTIFLLLFFWSGIYAASTSITLTAPSVPQTVRDGDDYFTDIQYNRIDFDKRRDLLWEGKFDETSITVSNNTWTGTHLSNGAVWALDNGKPSAIPLGLIGQNYPLDSSKYNFLSTQYRLSQRRLTDDNVTWYQFWWKDVNSDTFDVFSGLDGYATTNSRVMNEDNIFITYLNDLSSNTVWTDAPIIEIKHVAPVRNFPATVDYRWFRMVDITTSPTITIEWTADISPEDMPPAGTPQVAVYFDDDNNSHDGTLLFRYDGGGTPTRNLAYDSGTFLLPTAVLAPGSYYFYLKLFDNYDNDTLLATSGYSAAVTVNGKSIINFEHPSKTSGSDYATDVLGDPWDMNNSEDIHTAFNVTNESFSNGVYTATTATSDSKLFLNIDFNTPIDTTKYHYLTYTMEMNLTGWETYDINYKLGNGWVSRLVWGHNDTLYDLDNYSDDIIDYEGINTMTLDLRSDCLDPDVTTLPQNGWLATDSVYNMRFDPLETTQATTFYLYDIKLTADPEPDENGTFTAKFVLEDPENDSAVVRFYVDNNRSGFNGKFIGSRTFNAGSNTMSFDTTRWHKGENYLYTIITDSAGNVSSRYSDTPIIVTNVRSAFSPTIIYYLLW